MLGLFPAIFPFSPCTTACCSWWQPCRRTIPRKGWRRQGRSRGSGQSCRFKLRRVKKIKGKNALKHVLFCEQTADFLPSLLLHQEDFSLSQHFRNSLSYVTSYQPMIRSSPQKNVSSFYCRSKILWIFLDQNNVLVVSSHCFQSSAVNFFHSFLSPAFGLPFHRQ